MDADHLARFRADLTQLTAGEMFERYVVPPHCFGIPEMDEAALRAAVAGQFDIESDCIIIVGSAKLGFTLCDKEPSYEEDEFRPRFSPLGPQSDVDVAIVSDSLFDRIWKQCLEFTDTSGYTRALNWPRAKGFESYVFKGWIRPDMFPLEAAGSPRQRWADFFRRITREGLAHGYSVTAGLYRERYFLERYQAKSINQAREQEAAI